jgi:hypothetical protein
MNLKLPKGIAVPFSLLLKNLRARSDVIYLSPLDFITENPLTKVQAKHAPPSAREFTANHAQNRKGDQMMSNSTGQIRQNQEVSYNSRLARVTVKKGLEDPGERDR